MTHAVLKVKYTFYASDGSNVSCLVIGEAMDSADKAASKAMSIAFKYACFQMLCIPTEDTAPDPDAEYHEKAPKKPAPPAPAEPPVLCQKCGKEIKAVKGKDGKIVAPKDVAETLGGLCADCWKASKPDKPME